MQHSVYGLIDPRNSEIKYIGKSAYPLRRYSEHLEPGQLAKRNHKANWLRGLIKQKMKPELIILQSGLSSEEINEAECFSYLEKTDDFNQWRLEQLRIKKQRSSRFDPIMIIETGQKFESVKALAKFLNTDSKSISRVLGGRRSTLKGFTFKKLNQDEIV